MRNSEVANILREIADLLELQEITFKPIAFRRAAQNIENLSDPIEDYWKKENLESIPGIGEGISKKISEYLETGKIKLLSRLKKEVPIDLDIIKIPEIGPKTAKILYKKLKIKTVKQLAKAAGQHKISKLKGFAEKTEFDILKGIKIFQSGRGRTLLGLALPIAREIENKLSRLNYVQKAIIGGSLRRREETIGDIDILVQTANPKKVTKFFTTLPDIKDVLAKGATKSSIRLKNNLQVDLRVIEKQSYGAALQYFTGNKAHNIKLRRIAISKKLKLSEYGIFKGKKQVAGKTEQEVYKRLSLPYIEPELRQDQGEIEAASKHKLPKLIDYSDINGDLQMHSTWSDGKNTIEEMAQAAKNLKYKYISLTDHYKLPIANGLNPRRTRNYVKAIDKTNKKITNLKIFKSVEANIGSNGKLDLPKTLDKQFDYISAGIHSKFKMSNNEMTKRVVNAIADKRMKVFVHLTARRINLRDPISADIEKIFQAAADNDVILEINSSPERLDLKDVHIRKALDYKVRLSLGTDAHHKDQLKQIELGIAQARRGWAEKKDIINTKSVSQIEKLIR